MCGIAGILSPGIAEINRESLDAMLSAIAHRGHDASRTVLSGQGGLETPAGVSLGLGHRRLSIIDLDPRAHQPFHLAAEGLWIVYNGELYNYLELGAELASLGLTMETSSDTEVLLKSYHVWGEQCVDHFRGMFAFAIWDERNKILFCARDQFGVKPFYYAHHNGDLLFASESRALLGIVGKELDRVAVMAYFLGGFVPGELSIFKGIKKLLPGHSLSWSEQGGVQVRRYWVNRQNRAELPCADPAEYFDGKLEECVRLQVRSDVPVGAFLSGGTDSGMIVAKAANYVDELTTFCVAYKGLDYDESLVAGEVAKRYGSRHIELKITSEHGLELMRDALGNCSEPVSDTALASTYLVAKRAAEMGIKVLLGGSGGDEIFGGYTRYVDRQFKQKLFLSSPQALARLVLALSSRPTYQKVEFLKRRGDVSFDMFICAGGSSKLLWELSGMQEEEFNLNVELILQQAFYPSGKMHDRLFARMDADLRCYLPDQLNFLYDQATMAHTIEGRVPFQDVTLVESAFALAPRDLVSDGKLKVLLKSIAARYLPQDFASLPKLGFGGPYDVWVKSHRDEMASAMRFLSEAGVLNEAAVKSYLPLLLGTSSISREDTNAIFRIWCFAAWYRKFIGAGE